MKGSERGSECVSLVPDAQERKETKEQGYETGRMTGRLVALTGTPSWPFMRDCKACLTQIPVIQSNTPTSGSPRWNRRYTCLSVISP